jgi:general stress protein 26
MHRMNEHERTPHHNADGERAGYTTAETEDHGKVVGGHTPAEPLGGDYTAAETDDADPDHTGGARSSTERASETAANEVTGPEAVARVKELVEDIDIAMLTTSDDDGNLVARPMSTREMDAAGDIWFFTSDASKKVDEVEADHDVGLSYVDAKGMRFVSVAGRARVVHDPAKMEQLYTPSLDVWFEHGLQTPDIALLRVTPVETEFWEPAHGKLVMAAGMLKALVTRDLPDDTMRHGRISR